MGDQSTPWKWHVIDSTAAQTLTTVTNSPGVVYPLPVAELPESLQGMRGVSSYYVTGYTTGQSLPPSFTAGGELLVARVDGELDTGLNFFENLAFLHVLRSRSPEPLLPAVSAIFSFRSATLVLGLLVGTALHASAWHGSRLTRRWRGPA